MRKCRNCGYRIDDDNLIVCPNCQSSPSETPLDLPEGAYKRLRRDVIKSFFLWVFGPFTVVGTIGYILFISSGIREAHRQIRSRVTDEFKEPRIRDIVSSVAENEAKVILEQEIQPALGQLKDSTAKIEEAKRFAEQFRNQYEAKLSTVEDQLKILKEYNTLASLSARAISDADRKSFDALKVKWTETDSGDIKQAALASMLTVKSFYINASRTENYRLRDYSGPLGIQPTPKSNEEYTAAELIQFLETAQDWRARAVSARLLASKVTKKVPGMLLEAAEKDANLDVVRDAKRSFGRITGFNDGDILNTEEMRGWWILNSEDVLDKLPAD